MASQPTLGWNPQRTWVFVVGTLEWQQADQFSPFPKENRRDAALVAFFRAQGVPPTQLVYLQDRHATTNRIQQTFESHLAAANPDDLLILYYCGHGGKTDAGTAYFASYDTDCDTNQGWIMETVPATIERYFDGSHALLFADCCYSGCLADAVSQYAKKIAYATLTSSLSSEVSTGNWTFTEGLLAGLRGQAFVDADGNNAISLSELATQMMASMAFAEEQLATFATVGTFDPNMIIAAARPRLDPHIGNRVEVATDGDWYPAQIIDVRAGQFKVHYYGYEESDDEWVTSDSMREAARKVYPVGTAVEVQWKRKWYPATVVAVRFGIHQIQYAGYSSTWNEWVAAKRIRV